VKTEPNPEFAKDLLNGIKNSADFDLSKRFRSTLSHKNQVIGPGHSTIHGSLIHVFQKLVRTCSGFEWKGQIQLEVPNIL